MNKLIIFWSFKEKIYYRWIIALEQSKNNYLWSNPDQLLEGSVCIDNEEEGARKPQDRGQTLFFKNWFLLDF